MMPRLITAILLLLAGGHAAVAQPFIGDVITVAFDFCPSGWLPLDGRLIPIIENEALFQLIGTDYGGDGVDNYALPLAEPVLTADRKPLLQCISQFGVFPSPN